MRAIDTNVIVRFLTKDDPEQAERARRVIDEGEIFVATTVMLEAEWVLRSAYGFPVRQIVAALRSFIGLVSVKLEDQALVIQALDRAEAGMDFADALHLGRAQDCSSFVSFDRKLAAAAAGLSAIRVTEP